MAGRRVIGKQRRRSPESQETEYVGGEMLNLPGDDRSKQSKKFTYLKKFTVHRENLNFQSLITGAQLQRLKKKFNYNGTIGRRYRAPPTFLVGLPHANLVALSISVFFMRNRSHNAYWLW